MLDVLAPIAAACDISVAPEHRLPLAIVGAGAIVDVAHLPAYRSAGLEVRGLLDLDTGRAREMAERHGVPTVYASLDELLSDPGVRVVDIAVAPQAQSEIALRALEAGKHLLCQKPFVLDETTGEQLVAVADRLGLKIAVNQQLRYDEGIAAARAMVHAGWIGEPTAMTFTVDIATDWTPWPWLVRSERLEIMYHSIHYLDAVRSVLGEPETVFCTGGRTPGQVVTGETRTISTLVFPGHARALVHATHENRTGDPQALFRINGSHGSIRGTLGLLYDYPNGRPDTVEVNSRALPTDGWLSYPVTHRWIPDAFLGPMASLLRAVADDGEPYPSARDNLGTIRLVDRLYASMDAGRSMPMGR
ncbi:Gfo/Idh/MocA family protein [Streptomyces nigrescens]|uniref:Gfo/Idh/MocA family oxidoreductase n=1 Tax=Streptomyces nigrescens TaxID=1920 RepID=A0ABY7IXP6_STRNI|nr:Gfo/Idh/MocA family oxidoreductase [Streptomyces nigrescens]WAU03764.1 Gfo/Idh/MocA family oxidoreductase [Streptomyces nigrescens]